MLLLLKTFLHRQGQNSTTKININLVLSLKYLYIETYSFIQKKIGGKSFTFRNKLHLLNTFKLLEHSINGALHEYTRTYIFISSPPHHLHRKNCKYGYNKANQKPFYLSRCTIRIYIHFAL